MKQVMLSVPDTVYQEVELAAEAEGRSISDVLHERIRSTPSHLHVNTKRAAMQREVRAYEQIHAELWHEYPDQYIAIYQGQVVAHNKDVVKVVAHVRAQYPEDVVLIRRVQSELPQPLRMPSVRWA